jgi:hypothetical protein
MHYCIGLKRELHMVKAEKQQRRGIFGNDTVRFEAERPSIKIFIDL